MTRFTEEQKTAIAGWWNAGDAPDVIARKLGGQFEPREVREQLRTMDLARPTRPYTPPGV